MYGALQPTGISRCLAMHTSSRWEGALLGARDAVALLNKHCGSVAGILARDESPAGGEPPAYRLVVATVARPLLQSQLGSLPPSCRSVTPTCACLN